MLARRFLWIIAGLVMLTLAAALGYRLFGERIMKAAMVPSISFAQSRQDHAPDYADSRMWIARPGLDGDPSRWTPSGFSAAPHPAIAVFYVAPTTYLKPDRWNGPLTGGDDGRARVFTQTQSSVFNGIGAVWAPHYRQATFGAFMTHRQDAQKALDFAYQDVLSAFDVFVASIPANQPIILAGHSQGSLHLLRLLRERIAGKPLARRIIAVYAPGWPISVSADLPALGLPACASSDQSGCILSWQSFAEPAEPAMILDSYDGTIGFTGQPRQGTAMLCVNPLTGAPATAAPASANIGALEPTQNPREPMLVAGKVPAHCGTDGLLLIGQPLHSLGGYVLPGNNYHVYDYVLFWANLRADAERRAASFAAQRK